MVSQDCKRLGEVVRLGQWHCAMLAFAAFRGDRVSGKPGFRWHKLPDAARYFGVPPGGHRAGADAEACRQVVIKMAAATSYLTVN